MPSADKRYRVAVVGATGAVGQTVLRILEERSFPVNELIAYASKKSLGKSLPFRDSKIQINELSADVSFAGVDFVFFCAGGEISKKFASRAADAGAIVIDNSSVFRLDPSVPLVVPEVNGDVLKGFKSGIIANPNCTTAQLVMALKPLSDQYGITRVVVSSYQAVSGKGYRGIDEFLEQARDVLEGEQVEGHEFPYPIAFNALPQVDVFKDDGFTGEEHKVMNETRKIMQDESLCVVATCVRVPVVNCHSESVLIETRKPVDIEMARKALTAFPGVKLLDEIVVGAVSEGKKSRYPLATLASGKDEVFVGRLRYDTSLENKQMGLHLWVVADNLRKGAALNAVQIAETVLKLRQ